MSILAPRRDAAPTTTPIPPLIPIPTTSTTTSSTTSTTSTSTTSSSSTTTPTSTTTTTTPTTTPTSTTSSTSNNVTTSTSSSTTLTSSTSSTTSSPTTTSTTDTGGEIVTITSTQVASSTTSGSTTPSSLPSTSRGFFQNRGAVAGVFTVVGLVAVVLLIVLIVNFYRRRQAKKFDREIAEAAAEAAAARAPAFLDDENDHYGPGPGSAYAAKYSDVSHGTYSQPPMSESYGMREMGPSPGESYDPNMYGGVAGMGAGAAGIGVARARSRRDGAFAAGLQEGASPYAAFAGPQYNELYNASRTPPPDFRSPGPPERSLLDAAGLGAGTARVQRGPSQQTHQANYSDLSRNRSQGGVSSEAGHSSNQSHSYQPFNPPVTLQPGARRNPSTVQNTNTGTIYTNDDHEGDLPTGSLPNPFSATSEMHEHHDEGAESEEEEEPRRVLRVANE
ncbi:hypothetical protein AX15_000242 [Amanita polypyramis BW_CC]|nr:hypothetical protein AX15_000242 [Amanita polypyramis BW_CC]